MRVFKHPDITACFRRPSNTGFASRSVSLSCSVRAVVMMMSARRDEVPLYIDTCTVCRDK